MASVARWVATWSASGPSTSSSAPDVLGGGRLPLGLRDPAWSEPVALELLSISTAAGSSALAEDASEPAAGAGALGGHSIGSGGSGTVSDLMGGKSML